MKEEIWNELYLYLIRIEIGVFKNFKECARSPCNGNHFSSFYTNLALPFMYCGYLGILMLLICYTISTQHCTLFKPEAGMFTFAVVEGLFLFLFCCCYCCCCCCCCCCFGGGNIEIQFCLDADLEYSRVCIC